MMTFETTAIADARLIRLSPHSDMRGEFARVWCLDEFRRAGITFTPAQANTSSTLTRGTIRGMHFQRAPKTEAKLVRCARGRVWDVATDLRPQSPSFGMSVGVELAHEDNVVFYVPAGVAHGFQALTDNVTMEYLMGEAYAPVLADGFRYDDTAAGIAWPLPAALVSERDLAWPPLATRLSWPPAGEPVDGRRPESTLAG